MMNFKKLPLAFMVTSSLFAQATYAMDTEEEKIFSKSLSKIDSKLNSKKPNEKRVKRKPLWKKKSSKKSILAAQIDAYKAKGRRNAFSEL